MRAVVAFKETLSQAMVDVLEWMIAAITTSYHREHNQDDTHGDVTADTVVSRGRIAAGTVPTEGNTSGAFNETTRPADAVDASQTLSAARISLNDGLGGAAVTGQVAIEVFDNSDTGSFFSRQKFFVTQEGRVGQQGPCVISMDTGLGWSDGFKVITPSDVTRGGNFQVTWNDGSTTYNALRVYITDTSSAAASLALTVANGSGNLFEVDKDGDVRIAGNVRQPDDGGDALRIGNGTTTSVQDVWLWNNEADTAEIGRLTSDGLRLGDAGVAAPLLREGTGTPEGALSSPVGSLYMRRDGGASTTLYVKESGTGNTGWVAK